MEAERLERIISCRVPHASSLLDVGCGTGRHLEYLRSHYEVAGVDISEQLLAQARKRLPGVPLYLGDLRSFDLGRRFDVVTWRSVAPQLILGTREASRPAARPPAAEAEGRHSKPATAVPRRFSVANRDNGPSYLGNLLELAQTHAAPAAHRRHSRDGSTVRKMLSSEGLGRAARRSVTPEVAGSSPVAPAQAFTCKSAGYVVS